MGRLGEEGRRNKVRECRVVGEERWGGGGIGSLVGGSACFPLL